MKTIGHFLLFLALIPKVGLAIADSRPEKPPDIYLQQLNRYIPIPPKLPPRLCSCVIGAKLLTGYNKSVGFAKNWPKNSLIPVVGGVVITDEDKLGRGHVAVITEIQGDYLILDEWNYSPCDRTTGRKLSIYNPLILGYWIP